MEAHKEMIKNIESENSSIKEVAEKLTIEKDGLKECIVEFKTVNVAHQCSVLFPSKMIPD